MISLSEVTNGTILVSNSLQGSRFVKVASHMSGRFGDWLQCVGMGDSEGEFESVHSVGAEDMAGIGWKLASKQEIERLHRYQLA